ncbi:hypothetical protein ACHAWF_013956 [Thalassiosira exigua]
MAQRYDSVDYWDDRYGSDKEPFEWYQNYEGVRHFLTPKYLCQPKRGGESDSRKSLASRILNVGCGNSRVGEGLLSEHGQREITNVDFSSTVVNQMKAKYTDAWHDKFFERLRRERKLDNDEAMISPAKNRTRSTSRSLPKKRTAPVKLTFQCMDVTKKLGFPDQSFDLVFCKYHSLLFLLFKGTLDAVLCGANTGERVQRMMEECHRVLDREHGAMVIVSYGAPEGRLNCFDNSRWDVKTYTVPKPMVPGEKVGE